jgi:hypothetical protein
MENGNECIVVLEEGIEESLEALTSCCKVGPARLNP